MNKTKSILASMAMGKSEIVPKEPEHVGKPIEPGLSLDECTKIIFKAGCVMPFETEMEIYNIIEGLGGITWRMGHDAADGRMDLSENDMSFMSVSRRFSYLLIQRLKDRYGVIPPDECPQREIGDRTPLPPAPSGSIYYWDWYKRMQDEYYAADFEKIICSGCALHEDNPVEKMRSHIPCKPYPGMLYNLTVPFECAMLNEGCFKGDWDRERLHEELIKVGGDKAVQDFKNKYHQLTNKPFVFNF